MRDFRAPVRVIAPGAALLLLPDGGLQTGGVRFIPRDLAAAMAAARDAARRPLTQNAEQHAGIVS